MGKKVTVGYKYYFGLHLILASNPLKLLTIQLQDRNIWNTPVFDGFIYASHSELFDNNKGEGGFEGYIEVLSGRQSTQGVSPYFKTVWSDDSTVNGVITEIIPGFRRVFSLLFCKSYMGNSPYPKRIKLKVQDAHIWNEWYPEKAWLKFRNAMGDVDASGTPITQPVTKDIYARMGSPALKLDTYPDSDIWWDMNPAHIARHVLTSKDTGGDGTGGQIGASFTTAADTLFAENFGLSFLWRNSGTRKEFIETIERHVNGSIYFDRYTNRWEFKLIRNDYNVATLPIFDTHNVIKWGDDFDRENQRELPNQITVNYRKREDGEQGAVTVTNTASIQQLGRIKPIKLDYEGIYNPPLAIKVAYREMQTLSQPKWTGSFTAIDVPIDMNVGSAFILRNEHFGIEGIIARVVERTDISEKSNEVTIKFVQDRFSLGSGDLPVEFDDVPVANKKAISSDPRLAEEQPYYLSVMDNSQAKVNSELEVDPDGGVLHTAVTRPNFDHQYATLYTAPAGDPNWENAGRIDFSPSAKLLEDVTFGADDNVFFIGRGDQLSNVVPGTVAIINDEYVRVDSIVAVTGGSNLTVGRAVIDMPPRNHPKGSQIIFFDDFAYTDFKTYTFGDNIRVRQPTSTATNTQKIGNAPEDLVYFNSRAIRPYPVGDLRVNGQYVLANELDSSVSHTLTWAGRNRKFQTTKTPEDHTYGNITPEAGTEYIVEVRTLDQVEAKRLAGSGGYAKIQDMPGVLEKEILVGTSTSWSFLHGDVFSKGLFTKLAVRTQRGGYVNRKTPSVIIVGAGAFGYGLGYSTRYGGK